MSESMYDGQRLTLDEYLATPVTRTRYELAYGVREQWLLEPWALAIEVVDLSTDAIISTRYANDQVLHSAVPPRLRWQAGPVF